MKTLGVLGTAKNTGKTTTLNAVIKCLSKHRLAITSIGFDGENIDFITGLPKPKVLVDQGMIVATTDKSERYSTAKMGLLLQTNIKTAMGIVGIYRVKEPGTAVLVGPNRGSELKTLINQTERFEAELLMVDGAVNRMIPFQSVENIIIATGASRSTEVETLLTETLVMIKCFKLPTIEADDFHRVQNLITKDDIDALHGKDKILVQGIVTSEALKHLLSLEKKIKLLLSSPMHILMIDSYPVLSKALESKIVDFAVLKKPKLLCVTVNPCYPEQRQQGYTLSKVDLNHIIKNIISRTSTVVVNVDKEESTLCQVLEASL